MNLAGYKLASYGDNTIATVAYHGTGSFVPSQGTGRLPVVCR